MALMIKFIIKEMLGMSKYKNESLPKEERIGQVGYNNQGLKMTIIKYHIQTNIDVQFEDGTIVEHKHYKNFKEGTIVNPNHISSRIQNRVGETNINNKGFKMTIIEYRNARDIDIQFEDGTIIEHTTYAQFHQGTLSKKVRKKRKTQNYTNRKGETNVNNQGLKMTIIEYRKSNDIDVQFEDGTIITNRRYSDFQAKHIANPNYQNAQIKNRVGEKRMSNCGYEMTIIEYNGAKDMTIEIEVEINNIIHKIKKENVQYEDFNIGGVKVDLIIDGKRYAKCSYCGEILEINEDNFYQYICLKQNVNSHRCKKCDKKYRAENPHLAFNSSNNRRLKEEEQGKGVNKEQWEEMMAFFGWRCAYSNEILNDERTVDHIISLDKNGVNEVWNCVPMLKEYNRCKNAKNPMEWYKQQEFFDEERLDKIIEWQIYAWNKWATEEDVPLVLIIDENNKKVA